MPAITKDEAIQVLREAIAAYLLIGTYKNRLKLCQSIAATEHITEAAATQAAGLDAKFEEIRELLSDAYGFKSTSPKAQANINAVLDILDGVDIHRQALEIIAVGDSAEPSATAEDALVSSGYWSAPALISHIKKRSAEPLLLEPPALPEPWIRNLNAPEGSKDHFAADQMISFYREGYAAGRASLKGNKP